MELVWEDKSLGFERKLCVSEYVKGRSRSRLELVWLEPLEKKGGRDPGVLLLGRFCESLASLGLGRGAKGLIKVGDAGVIGLSGVRSGTYDCMNC